MGSTVLNSSMAVLFDLIVMNFFMSQLSGLEATAESRQRDASRGDPTRMQAREMRAPNILTPLGVFPAAGVAKEDRVDGFLLKPHEAEDLTEEFTVARQQTLYTFEIQSSLRVTIRGTDLCPPFLRVKIP